MYILLDIILFSMIGYLSEVIYCSLNKRKSGKALYGPWCPLYALGGILILNTVGNTNNILIVYTLGTILSSITEYFVSVILEIIFNTRWWDYSNKKYNLNGRICLENSLLFGILSLFVVYIYKPFKYFIINNTNPIYLILSIIIISIIILIDAILTILEALEIKQRLYIIDKTGINSKTKNKLNKIKPYFNIKRLLNEFDFQDKPNINFLKRFYKKK